MKSQKAQIKLNFLVHILNKLHLVQDRLFHINYNNTVKLFVHNLSNLHFVQDIVLAEKKRKRKHDYTITGKSINFHTKLLLFDLER